VECNSTSSNYPNVLPIRQEPEVAKLLRRASVGNRESNPIFPPYRETDCHRLRKPIAHQGVARILLSDLVTRILLLVNVIH
jgi:hypothetical protein